MEHWCEASLDKSLDTSVEMDSFISVDFSLSYVPTPMNNQSDVSSNEEVEDDDDFCEELLDEVRSATYAKT